MRGWFWIHPSKPRRRDANDGELDFTEAGSLPDYGRIGAELLFPKVMTQNDDGVPSGNLILVVPEVTPELWLHFEDPEEIASHQLAQPYMRQCAGPAENPAVTFVNAASPSKL